MLRNLSYINGKWTAAASGATFPVTDPATGDTICLVADLSVQEVSASIDAAGAAFGTWSALTAKERALMLKKWYELIMHNKEELAAIMTRECGKPLQESRGEVDYGAAYVEWFAEEARRVYGDVIPAHTSDRRLLTLKQPVGVVAAITPWNFPLAMITRKVAPAIAAGCTIVLKPAKETPLTALALAALAEQSGIPPGVLNIVTSFNSTVIGQEFCTNEKVRKLSFTGSTGIGKILMEQCASNIKKLSLELGGNAPFIVFDDADLDLSIKGALVSKYRNSGQTCVCTNRFLIQEGIYDRFVGKLTEATRKLKVGNGTNPDTNIGPLINKKGFNKVVELVADAVQKGGSILTGGKALTGLFFEPTVISGASSKMMCAEEEIFGPVSVVYKFKTEEEAIQMANDTVFGLASYFYSNDIGRCWRVAEKLEYGMVGINEGLISTEVAPFGGIKQSGLGREGSKYGIDEYTELKYLCFGAITGKKEI
jgi:succinate-semialdehyde dehydrogenase/glutarate-semialdehyde dehydrogenase